MTECSEYLVTDIIDINNKKKRVYINEKAEFSLYTGELKKLGIEKNASIPSETYLMIFKEILPKRAKMRAMHLLKSNDFTEYSLKRKLQDNDYPESIISDTIDAMKVYGYIDDRRYARNYLMFKGNSKNKTQITVFLLKKGISKELIQEVCNEFYQDHEEQEDILIEKFIKKKYREIMHLSYEQKSKILGCLTRKGFSFEASDRAIYKIFNK